MRNSIVAGLIAMMVLLVSVPVTSSACSCVPPDSARKALERAGVAFRGLVTRIDYLDQGLQAPIEPRIVVYFKVFRVWKGDVGAEQLIHTVYNRYTCRGYFFEQGGAYLVFARHSTAHDRELFAPHKLPEAAYAVSLCNGTSSVAEPLGRRFLQELGPGAKPRGGSGTTAAQLPVAAEPAQ